MNNDHLVRITRIRVAVCLTTLIASLSAAAADEPVDFASQIRPILSENCFACHGRMARSSLQVHRGK